MRGLRSFEEREGGVRSEHAHSRMQSFLQVARRAGRLGRRLHPLQRPLHCEAGHGIRPPSRLQHRLSLRHLPRRRHLHDW